MLGAMTLRHISDTYFCIFWIWGTNSFGIALSVRTWVRPSYRSSSEAAWPKVVCRQTCLSWHVDIWLRKFPQVRIPGNIGNSFTAQMFQAGFVQRNPSQVWNVSSSFQGNIYFAVFKVLQPISWSFWPRVKSGQVKSVWRPLASFVDSTVAWFELRTMCFLMFRPTVSKSRNKYRDNTW